KDAKVPTGAAAATSQLSAAEEEEARRHAEKLRAIVRQQLASVLRSAMEASAGAATAAARGGGGVAGHGWSNAGGKGVSAGGGGAKSGGADEGVCEALSRGIEGEMFARLYRLSLDARQYKDKYKQLLLVFRNRKNAGLAAAVQEGRVSAETLATTDVVALCRGRNNP
ncbi:unnamed protein product, partial [Phaeothamnion confervicola]